MTTQWQVSQNLRPFASSSRWPEPGRGSLPPYSPDLNPIEQAFAKIKHWMRAAQKRTVEDTWRYIGDLVHAIEPDECSNYIANAGYDSIKT